MGVNWLMRRTAEGVHVVEWDGDWAGQAAGFFFVPERDFALTVLTNSTSGYRLTTDLFADDWTLQRFAGLRNPPAVPMRVSAARLPDVHATMAQWLGVPVPNGSGRPIGEILG